jgi:hypothetical protein
MRGQPLPGSLKHLGSWPPTAPPSCLSRKTPASVGAEHRLGEQRVSPLDGTGAETKRECRPGPADADDLATVTTWQTTLLA